MPRSSKKKKKSSGKGESKKADEKESSSSSKSDSDSEPERQEYDSPPWWSLNVRRIARGLPSPAEFGEFKLLADPRNGRTKEELHERGFFGALREAFAGNDAARLSELVLVWQDAGSRLDVAQELRLTLTQAPPSLGLKKLEITKDKCTDAAFDEVLAGAEACGTLRWLIFRNLKRLSTNMLGALGRFAGQTQHVVRIDLDTCSKGPLTDRGFKRFCSRVQRGARELASGDGGVGGQPAGGSVLRKFILDERYWFEDESRDVDQELSNAYVGLFGALPRIEEVRLSKYSWDRTINGALERACGVDASLDIEATLFRNRTVREQEEAAAEEAKGLRGETAARLADLEDAVLFILEHEQFVPPDASGECERIRNTVRSRRVAALEGLGDDA
jgi:hypothetical protein